MLAQMQRLLDGRNLNRLSKREDASSANSIVPALIELYNPNACTNHQSLAFFNLQIAPDTIGELESFCSDQHLSELFLLREHYAYIPANLTATCDSFPSTVKYDLEYELFARQSNGTVVASVPIDDQKIPLFNYILQLAENVLYAPKSQASLNADGLPRVWLTMEYSIRGSEAKCEYGSLKVRCSV